ncbi:MAG TPA: diguanylate cyclase [Acidimicrobiales bacterium]|nr:diguanylate cyclase [Acidimicrobiales bacterium]
MQNLDGGVRGGFPGAPGEAGAKVRPFVDPVSVVPAHRLLDLASALSDGASQMHACLRHLDPDDRDAILDLMAVQVRSIVDLWADLVRGVVPGSPRPAPADGVEHAGEAHGMSAVSTELPGDAASRDTEEAVSASSAWARRRDDERSEIASEPDSGPAVRLLPRRPAPTSDRQPWAPALRTVAVDEQESDYEGDRLIRDELTGVFNRQAGFAALGRELDRCRRAGERFVLGYLNVDGLKTVNSMEGPRAGDELLRKVTAALRATLRSYDVIMRLGGDKFLFSLPGADMATAELRAHEFGIILNEEAPGASASVGYSELRGNDTLDEIISRAEIELVKSRRSRVRSR